jgi:hypothetical protein
MDAPARIETAAGGETSPSVRLPVPGPAGTAVLILTIGPRRMRWWTGDGSEGPPVRSGKTTPDDLPEWVRAVLTDADGPWARDHDDIAVLVLQARPVPSPGGEAP